jgi:hypothetical protein
MNATEVRRKPQVETEVRGQSGPLTDASSELLIRTAEIAAGWLQSLDRRPVGESATVEELRSRLGGPLPETPLDPLLVVEDLARAAEPGLVAIPSGRYFGFVIGGGLPAAVAADWLTSAWDQCPGFYACGPAASVVEEVTGAWLQQLLGFPEARRSPSSPGARWPTSPAWPQHDTTSCKQSAGTSKSWACTDPHPSGSWWGPDAT